MTDLEHMLRKKLSFRSSLIYFCSPSTRIQKPVNKSGCSSSNVVKFCESSL